MTYSYLITLKETARHSAVSNVLKIIEARFGQHPLWRRQTGSKSVRFPPRVIPEPATDRAVTGTREGTVRLGGRDTPSIENSASVR